MSLQSKCIPRYQTSFLASTVVPLTVTARKSIYLVVKIMDADLFSLIIIRHPVISSQTMYTLLCKLAEAEFSILCEDSVAVSSANVTITIFLCHSKSVVNGPYKTGSRTLPCCRPTPTKLIGE